MTGPDRMKLPIRRAVFGGVTTRTLEGSQPDWSLIGHPEAPEGADASGDRMSGGIAGRPPDEGHIRVLRRAPWRGEAPASRNYPLGMMTDHHAWSEHASEASSTGRAMGSVPREGDQQGGELGDALRDLRVRRNDRERPGDRGVLAVRRPHVLERRKP